MWCNIPRYIVTEMNIYIILIAYICDILRPCEVSWLWVWHMCVDYMRYVCDSEYVYGTYVGSECVWFMWKLLWGKQTVFESVELTLKSWLPTLFPHMEGKYIVNFSHCWNHSPCHWTLLLFVRILDNSYQYNFIYTSQVIWWYNNCYVNDMKTF